MKNSEQPNDIATEPYHGPGPWLSSAGYLYASHALSLIGGVMIAGTAALFAHRHINQGVEWARNWGARTGGRSQRAITFFFGSSAGSHELHHAIEGLTNGNKEKLKELIANEEKGLFENLASKVTKWFSKSEHAGQFLEKQSEEKLSAFFIGGGLGGAAGWIGSTVWSFFKGHKTGNRGKHQFERAQHEIKNLRELNADLERINNDLHKKYIEAATEKPGKTALKSAQHEGMLQAEKAATPEIA